MPRARLRAGDRSIDGRGRSLAAPAVLRDGFRPFFLLAAIHAALGVPLWLWMHRTGAGPSGPFTGAAWHAHEMIFGFLAAVIAGFVLTAVPNWTGRLPLSGWRLGALAGLWALGRVAPALSGDPRLALAADLLFPLALAAAVWREVLAGRNWRNAPVAALLTFFAVANLLHHLEAMAWSPDGVAVRLALGAAALLMALIGGRVTPSFTRNWLAKEGARRLPTPFGTLDKLALAATATAVAGWVAAPDHAAAGALLALAGLLLAGRLLRWRGLGAWREPIVFVLHLGYGWLAAALLLLGVSTLAPDHVPASAALHALTAGAVGTMTLAVMTRASLGHTGRPIRADRPTLAIYAAVSAGAVFRVAAPLAPDLYWVLLTVGGLSWSGAFALFALRYGAMLLRPRLSS